MLNKYEPFVKRMSNWAGNMGVAMLLLIPAITFLDIVGSKFFNWPFPGSVELTGFLQSMLVPLAAALTLIVGHHIKVEIFTYRLSGNAKLVIDSIVSLLLCIFCIILTWQIVVYGISIKDSGEYSNTLNIPFYPVIFIMALAFIPLILAFFLDFLKLFGRSKK